MERSLDMQTRIDFIENEIKQFEEDYNNGLFVTVNDDLITTGRYGLKMEYDSYGLFVVLGERTQFRKD